MPGQGQRRTREDMIQAGLAFVGDFHRYPTWADVGPEYSVYALPSRGTIRKYFGGWPGYWGALQQAGARPMRSAATGAGRHTINHRVSPPQARSPGVADLSWMGGETTVHLRREHAPRFAQESPATPLPRMGCQPIVVIRRW